MLVDEAMRLPCAEPIPSPDFIGLGLVPVCNEGESTWYDRDGNPWWTITVDGVRYRQTYSVYAI